MPRVCSIVVIALALSGATPAAAQDPSAPLTLAAALREALQDNPDLIALRRDDDASRAAVPESRFLDPPMVETQIWGWPVTTLNPARTDMYMFMGEQDLPGRGKRAARELVATRDADMSRAQINVRVNEVLDEVTQAYVDLAAARATAAVYDEQRPLLRQMADLATARYATGHSTQSDTVKSVLELSRLQVEVVDWRQKAGIAEARLNTLLGRPADSPIGLLPIADTSDIDLATADATARDRHPELAMASAAVAREEAELARLQGERRPDFVIGGGYMLQPGGAGAWTAKAGISWPNAPWSRQRLNTEIDAQQKKVEAARAHRDAAAAQVTRSVREAVVSLQAARDRVRVIESSIGPNVEHAFAVAQVTYAANHGEFADLLDTERMLLSTRMDLIAARADVERAVADLAMAIGGIPED